MSIFGENVASYAVSWMFTAGGAMAFAVMWKRVEKIVRSKIRNVG